ncbi:unnamed protein product [Vitrella brassicaformis CCMP3155]|uniref:Uncharacterized protein n=1 Tax=Vitrella brassicaformis (strain CCMP3155) TaxID=1169540 RepID=A0A0G4GCW4_VITBC|nr:unnamed protein product [Vitrella brassicaformis CCMP3155]|eukprot:CEM26643.1 unnamed protein product [Vitrella brassicaformis CCMP3155]
MIVMRRFGLGFILVVGLAATVQPLLAAQRTDDRGRRGWAREATVPTARRGRTAIPTHTVRRLSAVVRRSRPLRTPPWPPTNTVLCWVLVSGRCCCSRSRWARQSANKLTSATNELSGSALAAIDNVEDRIRGLTADGAAYDQPRGAATITDSQHPGRSGGRYTSYSRSSRTQEDLATSTNTADREICNVTFDAHRIGVDAAAGKEYWTMDGYKYSSKDYDPMPCAKGDMCVVYTLFFVAWDGEPMEGWGEHPTTGKGICMRSSLADSCAKGKVYGLPEAHYIEELERKARSRSFCITPKPNFSGTVVQSLYHVGITLKRESLSLEAEGPLAISYESGGTKRIVYFPGSEEYKLPSK